MPKKFSVKVYDKKHLQLLAARLRKVQRLIDEATDKATRIASSTRFNDTSGEFHFDDFPAAKKEIDALFRELGRSLSMNVQEATTDAWGVANSKNDAMVDSMIASTGVALPKRATQRWYNRNERALNSFLKRSEQGMNLSTDVWNLAQYKRELELALEMGLPDGLSAAELSRDVRSYLKYPNKLFRRVRDEKGILRLSKAAEAFHPGQGVYRSSYKNALRLTATETNMAYRKADNLRWSQINFVIGQHIEPSRTNHPVVDICDELQGDYPKDFDFTGWHPFCKCFAIPKLASKEEFLKYQQAYIDGEDVSDWKFSGEVKDVPDNFKGWMQDNRERISNAKSLPYFIKDNPQYNVLNVRRNALQVSNERHRQRTLSQRRDIKTRWAQRTADLENSSALSDVIKTAQVMNIDELKVKTLTKKATSEQIIKKLAGGDMTSGSCSSVAFAYAGNRAGFDVNDFRGGKSQSFFSTTSNIMKIAEKVGGIVAKHTNDFTKAKDLLATVVEGKEYYFTCGSHAAIVRKTSKGFEYLELQSSSTNGWKPLDDKVLRWRFGAKRSHSSYGHSFETRDCIIEISQLKDDFFGFRKMLSFLNTKKAEQKKGKMGTIK
jgi:hypothetical protein